MLRVLIACERSQSFPGIAAAMASQWVSFLAERKEVSA